MGGILVHFPSVRNILEKKDGTDIGGLRPVQTLRRHTNERHMTLLRRAPEA